MRFLLRLASLITPRAERQEWLRQWESEFWYFARIHSRDERIRFCLGAFRDALSLRSEQPLSTLWTRPWVCLGLLTIASSVSGLLAALPNEPKLTAYFLMWALALVVVAVREGIPNPGGVRYWLFLSAKALLSTIVVLSVFCHATHLARTELQPHALIVVYVLTFRWVLSDQRKRCPVCLVRLGHPTRIGQPVSQLLDWCGTELVCPQGHGLLHVPEALRGSFSTSRWVRLDESWRILFPHRIASDP